MLSALLERNIGNCYIQRTQSNKQKNKIVSKSRHQLKYALARYDTKDQDDAILIETTIL